MSPRRFVISDTHWGHENILKFKRDDGSPLRPFASLDEMHNIMIHNWNSVVRPCDTVYHLGDVVINRKWLWIMEKLNGKKRLVRGNHDIFSTADFLKHFDEIYGVRAFPEKGVILSHIPLHPDSLDRWKYNIHGHTHSRVVKLPNGSPDKRYICVSVEHTNYAPVELDSLILS